MSSMMFNWRAPWGSSGVAEAIYMSATINPRTMLPYTPREILGICLHRFATDQRGLPSVGVRGDVAFRDCAVKDLSVSAPVTRPEIDRVVSLLTENGRVSVALDGVEVVGDGYEG